MRLFPRCSRQRSSANAARGGLEPAPAGRLRRFGSSITSTASHAAWSTPVRPDGIAVAHTSTLTDSVWQRLCLILPNLPVRLIRSRKPWRHFNPQRRKNRFMFFSLLALSLEDHLGLVTSPQPPLSAGYTLPCGHTAGHFSSGLPPSQWVGLTSFISPELPIQYSR